MFFRTKKSKHSANPTLQLVENYRAGDRIRQRVIVSLGTNFHIPKELRKYVARCVEQKLLGQTNLMMSTAIEDLIVENAEEFAEDRFYRIADKLLRHQSKIESDLYERADQTICR
jgi:hypothetical protein